ncbi:MAG: HAD-IIIC family phosphatase [Hyphomicrobiales bacterium]|nr:HAD-IIIC family phosphatase [Hyphomicrobiales bacterium]
MLARLQIRLSRWLRRNVEGLRHDYLMIAPGTVEGEHPRPLRVALLGACMVDKLSQAFAELGDVADVYLFSSRPNDPLPDADWSGYDAVVVSPNLRTLLGDDLAHLRFASDDELAAFMERVRAGLEVLLADVAAAIDGRAPVFVLSLFEPVATYQGLLLNGRRRSLHRIVTSLNDAMADALEGLPSCHYLELNDLMRHFGDRDLDDGYVNHFTHGGIKGKLSVPFHRAIVVRIWHALMVAKADRPIKLIVTDLDNTLWIGVLAEYDEIVPHLHTEGWPLGYVEALLEFKRRGGLLAIASKNDHDETVERFGKVWGARLKIEDFCATEINWGPKSQSVRRILEATNLQADNVLFIDDNPREIDEVTRAFPTIRTLSGDESLWRSHILYSPHTQVARITAESANRTDMIAAKAQRDRAAATMSRADYLRDLKIVARIRAIRRPQDPDRPRAVELLNKTNQFNTTGKRWSDAEVDALFREGGALIALSARDEFGDNGLVSVAALRGGVIEQVVLSCRVFGLGVETALLSHVLREHRPQAALFADTGRNKTCATLWRDLGMTEADGRWIVGAPPPAPEWVSVEIV